MLKDLKKDKWQWKFISHIEIIDKCKFKLVLSYHEIC